MTVVETEASRPHRAEPACEPAECETVARRAPAREMKVCGPEPAALHHHQSQMMRLERMATGVKRLRPAEPYLAGCKRRKAADDGEDAFRAGSLCWRDSREGCCGV